MQELVNSLLAQQAEIQKSLQILTILLEGAKAKTKARVQPEHKSIAYLKKYIDPIISQKKEEKRWHLYYRNVDQKKAEATLLRLLKKGIVRIKDASKQVVFSLIEAEPNDENKWKALRLDFTASEHIVFKSEMKRELEKVNNVDFSTQKPFKLCKLFHKAHSVQFSQSWTLLIEELEKDKSPINRA